MRVAVFQFPYEELEQSGIADIITVWRTHGVTRVSVTGCDNDREYGLLSATSRIPAEAYESVDDLTEMRQVWAGEDRYEYFFVIEPPRCHITNEYSQGMFAMNDFYFEEDGIRTRFAMTDEFVGHASDLLRERPEDDDGDCKLVQIRNYRGALTEDYPLDNLTDRQREVIAKAFTMGYFETPSEVSSEELADELGVDRSTVLETIRRAEKNLLDRLFSAGMTDPPRPR